MSLTVAFLELLGTGAVVTAAGLLSQGRNADRLLKGFTKFGAWRIRNLLRRLRLQQLIVYDENDELSPIHLTENGFVRNTKTFLKRSHSKRWDHFWRLILFDIPERTRSRQRFQKFLKSLGCYRVQKSIYVLPFECKEEILRLAANLRISSGVMVFTVPNLGPHEQHARTHFLRYRTKK